jgi:hypothetical protein
MEVNRAATSCLQGRLRRIRPVLYSPEIVEDDMQIGLRGRRPIQVGINDPSTNFDGGIVAEIVRGFENEPGRVQRLVPLRLIGIHTRAFAYDCAE